MPLWRPAFPGSFQEDSEVKTTTSSFMLRATWEVSSASVRSHSDEPIFGWFLSKRKGLAASTTANPSSFMVAVVGNAECYMVSEVYWIELR
jgi:hypothetical protein